MSRLRYLAASFIAPAAALVMPVALALHELYFGTTVLPDGSIDDAPMRGAGLFLLLVVPVLYIAAAVMYAATGHVAARMNRLTLKVVVLVNSLIPWALVVVGLVGTLANNRGALVNVFILLVVGVFTSVFAALGALVCWFAAGGKQLTSRPSGPPPAAAEL